MVYLSGVSQLPPHPICGSLHALTIAASLMNSSALAYWTRHLRIHRAAQAINAGGVVAYPTEAVWGLGCNPLDEWAVRRILELKGRKMAKGVILIAASVDQVEPFVGALDHAAWQKLASVGETATTWVVPASPLAPSWVTGGRTTIAVRITDHPLAAALCLVAGTALVSTSANPQGCLPARTATAVHRYFHGLLADITPGAVGGAAKPSEIRDIHSGHILRSGG